MDLPSRRIAQRGIELPPVPVPAAAYKPWSRVGSMIVTAGQLPLVNGRLLSAGRLGAEFDTLEGAEFAQTAALNVLAVLAQAAGETGIDGVSVTKVTVFVASTADFVEHHLVANGASECIVDLLGEQGKHARSAVGVAALPLGSPVEVEAIAHVIEV